MIEGRKIAYPVESNSQTVPARSSSLRHSMRTHFVMLRFGFISLASAAIDNLIFYFVFRASGTIAGAQFAGRACSVFFNYNLVRRSVFTSGESHSALLPRYLALALANALLSYAGIRLVHSFTTISVPLAKIMVETLLFITNFALQREFVFRK